jgi:hypothetical protein
MDASARGRLALLLFAIASLAAVAAGASTLAAAGAGPGTWLRNPIAWAVGGLLAAGLYRWGRAAWARTAALLAAPAGLAATFLAEPVEGVHRWVDIGPFHMNMAALLLPAAVVAAGLRVTSPLVLAAAAAIAILLILQPDASQAIAFAAAIALLLLRSRGPVALRVGLIAFFIAAATASLIGPDTLQPVREVEGIFALALETAPALAALGALALAAAAFAPLRLAGRGETGDTAAALCVYFVIVALAPLAGAYPVPLVGLGMSFPVGWWLAVGLLSAHGRATKDAANG